MFLETVGLADIGTTTAGNALLAPLLADEVGEGQAVFGHVGSESVRTNAAVCQEFL